MAFASAYPAREPLGEINTTPLIDVMLVLLIMMIMTIPIATNALPVDLPHGPPPPIVPDSLRNKVVVTDAGAILWNGEAVSQAQLLGLLGRTRQFPIEPELQFEPQANASYDLSARVLNLIKASGVTKFGFVGNERYREFGRR